MTKLNIKRLLAEYLTELFTTQYAGLRAIGTDEIKEADKKRYEEIRRMVEKMK